MLISHNTLCDEIGVNHELLLSFLWFDRGRTGKRLSTQIRPQEEVIIEIGVGKADGDMPQRGIFADRTGGWFPFMTIVVIHNMFHQIIFFLDHAFRGVPSFTSPIRPANFHSISNCMLAGMSTYKESNSEAMPALVIFT